MKKQIRAVMAAAVMIIAVAMTMTTWAGTWKHDSTGWRHVNANGTYQNSGWWQDTNGKWYFFDDSGYMLTDTWADGYYLGSDGACVKNVSADDAFCKDIKSQYGDNTVVFSKKVKDCGSYYEAEVDVYNGNPDSEDPDEPCPHFSTKVRIRKSAEVHRISSYGQEKISLDEYAEGAALQHFRICDAGTGFAQDSEGYITEFTDEDAD